MSRYSVGYEIGRFTGRCAATGESLQPGSPCIAALCEREADEGFDRLDFSLSAWESGSRPPRLFSYWRTVVAEPNRSNRLVIDDEVLLDMFHRLADDDRPQRQAFRFVLGLALMRKKALRCVGRREQDGAEFWLMAEKGSALEQAPTPLLNPRLGDDDVRAIADQLNDVLQGDV